MTTRLSIYFCQKKAGEPGNLVGLYVNFTIMEQKDVNNSEEKVQNMTPEQENEKVEDLLQEDQENTGTLDDQKDGEMESLKAQIAELKDKFLRQAAEYDNFRRRTARETLELGKTAGKDVIIPLLDVLDDMERAQKQMEADGNDNPINEGVVLIFNKLRNTLQSKGLKPMESINADFDPDMHEAVAEVPAPSSDLTGKVLDDLQKGYYLNDKIIRFAKVVVGK